MYLADLDLAIHTWITSLGGKYWRYCDDILIVVPRGRWGPILKRLEQELKPLALKRSQAKTQNISSNKLASKQQLQYLGFIFNGRETLIRSSSIHRYHRKLKKAIQAAEFRREDESAKSGKKAPLRQKSLYNMYSDLPLRGKKIRARKARQRYRGNFTHYMKKSAKLMDSTNIEHQRHKVLNKFRGSVRKHA